jgi:hypothetical protein
MASRISKIASDKQRRRHWGERETKKRLAHLEDLSTGLLRELFKQAKDLCIASIAGWDTVDFYNGPDCFSNAEMRRIEKASRMASSLRPSLRPRPNPNYRRLPPPSSNASRFVNGPALQSNWNGFQPNFPRPRAAEGNNLERAGPRDNDVCNTCGQRGHFSRDCPRSRNRRG